MTTVTLMLPLNMAENTRLKDLASDVKRLLEMMDARDKEYSTRFATIESTIEDTLKRSPQVEPSSSNPPFQVRNVNRFSPF